MIKFIALTFSTIPIVLSGCATPKYACGVPDGIGCKPLSEVHRMAQDGSLKSQAAPDNRDLAEQGQDDEGSLGSNTQRPPSTLSRRSTGLATVTPGTPLLIPPRTMRVWVAPWPDEGGTLHDETYLYLRLDNGHWVMEKP
ncbi:MAG: type IV conjugative transfer system lipoprotein TraV [Gammaproteobacteria bacterium]